MIAFRNPRFGSDGGLEAERRRLAEEQKVCKTRARKFSVETSRRRKALDERRKQWDVQEQRLRENILQQRRQQVQDVTERFQRAHLPLSQRRRQTLRRTVPNLDDALNQIQFISGNPQNSLTSSTNISRSCTPSPKPPAVSKSSHRQALSAVEAYNKLQQDQSGTEKQQDHSPQDSHASESCLSESLSSKDSLDNDDFERSAKNPQPSFSSFYVDSEKTRPPPPDPTKPSDPCPEPDLSGMVLLGGGGGGDSLALSRKQPKKHEASCWPHDKTHLSKPSWEFASVQKTAKADGRPALHSCNILALCELMNDDSEDFKTNSPRSASREHVVVVAAGDASGKPESSRPEQETLLGIKEQKSYDVKQLKYPSATEIPPPAKNGNGQGVLFGYTSEPNIFLSDSNLAKEEAPPLQDSRFLSSQSAFINNLNKASDAHRKHEKPLSAAALQHVCLSGVQSGARRCQEYLQEEALKLPVAEAAPRSAACEVRFIKGILKKQSNHVAGIPAYAYGAGHFLFAKQVALAIRDSVELTRAKAKDPESNGGVKKKLRWFDEVHVEKEAKEQNAVKYARGRSSKNNGEDHQLSLAGGSGTPKTGPCVTPAAAAAAYHFTKEAWADVGVQTGLSLERSDEVKVPRSNARAGGPRVPRRERSARAAAGPVSSRTRKGTVVRPQSATEVTQIAKAQGRVMAPRPPPRAESAAVALAKLSYVPKTPYVLDLAALHYKQALEQTPHRSNSDAFPADCNVTYALLPPPPPLPPSGSGHQETHVCSSSRRRAVASGEKGLCLDCTPTEEEIAALWHNVHSALTTKDAKAAPRRQAPENGRVLPRKPCVQPCVQPPGPGNRRPLPTSQPTKQTTQLARAFPFSSCAAFPNRGSESTAQFHLAEAHAQGLLEDERDAAGAMETAQTQKAGQQQQQAQQRGGLTNISLEEQKILMSLERLNHQLHCVQEYVGAHSGLEPQTSAGDARVNTYKRSASSANSRSRYQKKS
ncbi:unnamed protein product [Ophioblennius macclurei]